MGYPSNDEECNCKIDAQTIYLHRERKDGSQYTVVAEVGDKCGQPAVISYRSPVTNKREHRCQIHLNKK